MKKFLTLAACILGLAPNISPAEQSDSPAQIGLAEIGLERRITVLQTQPTPNAFEIGMLQSLRAVEKTLQTRYDYGLGDRLVELPLLRLQIGGMTHPQPKTAQPDTLSLIVRTFVADLRQAQASLTNGATDGIHPFELTLQDLWFDIDGDGQRRPEEDAISILAPVILGAGTMQNPETATLMETPLTIRFDEADHDWLLAYTHLLSGFGNAFLAFDPTPVIQHLSHQQALLAKAPKIEYAYNVETITAEIVELKALQDQIKAKIGAFSATDARNSELRELRRSERFLREEIRSAEAKLPESSQQRRRRDFLSQSTLDTFYIVIAALRQHPDPDHIRAVQQDWRAVITYNKSFWAKLDAETDNHREWIPNPQQTSALPLSVPQEVSEAWQSILSDAEAVLEGKLLIPHPLLPDGYGINAAAYFNDPGPLNLLDWVHGVGAYKYTASGPMITRQSWRSFNRLTRGNAGGFALLLN